MRVLPTEGPEHHTVGSDMGEGFTVRELDHETPGQQNWKSDEDLVPRDLLYGTMLEPL